MIAMHEHPRFDKLRTALAGVQDDVRRRWSGPIYRCVAPKWARPEHLVSGKGSLKSGSRWMRPGVTPAVYAASSESIALKESRRVVRHFGIKRPRNQPRVMVELEAELERVADLTKLEDHLSWPGIDELLAENWEALNAAGKETLSQAVGRALHELDFSGLLVPSARDRRGRNLIWFPENLGGSEQVRIVGEDELDQWIAK